MRWRLMVLFVLFVFLFSANVQGVDLKRKSRKILAWKKVNDRILGIQTGGFLCNLNVNVKKTESKIILWDEIRYISVSYVENSGGNGNISKSVVYTTISK